MARRNHSGSSRRQRTSVRSGFIDRHRLRMRQLQARRTRLRGYLSNAEEADVIVSGGEVDIPFDRELEREPLI
ncbi:hypothetical protein [Microbulbifer variabilis]|uniref:hypothetical protein n=1 Tax=Microbulbifer variabilis TaxID=266805 RepID=UPI001CFD2E08|nr:hypothetical protein [Microbulbifer variabilis]